LTKQPVSSKLQPDNPSSCKNQIEWNRRITLAVDNRLMKKTDALTSWAIAGLSVALLAGCVATDTNRGGESKNDGEYQSPSPYKRNSTRKRLKVQAKNSISARLKHKAEPKNARQKKKEALLGQRVVMSGDTNTGSKPSANTGSVHFVCVPKCYVRQTPHTNSPAIAELLEYDWVRVLKTRSSWCQVQTGAGSVGWLSQNMIK
jgi:hypothetical protein